MQASSLTLLEKIPARLFSWNFCNIFKSTSYFLNYFGWLVLNVTCKEVFSLPHETLKRKHYFNVISTKPILFFIIVLAVFTPSLHNIYVIINDQVFQIVHKKIDEWYNEWQRMTASENVSYNEWQRMTTSDNEWYNEWQRMTTSDNEWYNEWQRMETSGTANDNEWYNGWQQRYCDLFKPTLIIGLCFTIF